MDTVFLAISAVSLAAIAVFLIPFLIETRRAIDSLRKTLDCELGPTLEELRSTLKNLGNISKNVDEVTEDFKELSNSVRDVGRTISAVNSLVSGLGSSTAVKALSLKAGVKAAVVYFLTNLLRKGDEK